MIKERHVEIRTGWSLQGRLHPNIRDPTAAELIHHLFPPLAFLIDACIDLFDEEVQREVVSPSLTPLAITLLKNSLSSRSDMSESINLSTNIHSKRVADMGCLWRLLEAAEI